MPTALLNVVTMEARTTLILTESEKPTKQDY